jgi:ferritin-like metal-binding protein YciE
MQMTRGEPKDNILKRYLEDAIAAERNFETQLREMSKEGDNTTAQKAFAEHADQTRAQHQRLEKRLGALGGSASGFKTFMAHVFHFAPKAAQLGHDESEKATQNLIISFSVENAEIAMYEALAAVAKAAGDRETELLAREIQEEERKTASTVWHMIASSAERSYNKISEAA